MKPIGKQDILTLAIGKSPKKGHMQGTGKFVNASTYYHIYKGTEHGESHMTQRMQELENKIEELSDIIRKSSRFSEMDSCSFAFKSVESCRDKGNEGVQCVAAGDDGEVRKNFSLMNKCINLVFL